MASHFSSLQKMTGTNVRSDFYLPILVANAPLAEICEDVVRLLPIAAAMRVYADLPRGGRAPLVGVAMKTGKPVVEPNVLNGHGRRRSGVR